MNMHVNPMVSDGQFTIGYDADGVAGQWPGNMAETCKPLDWMPAKIDTEFSDGNEWWTTIEDGGQIVWQNPNGSITPVREILEAGGDK